MEKEVFNHYRNNIVNEYVSDLQKLDTMGALVYHKARAKKIYKYYEKKRLEIRRFFMCEETKPMDRHKIGASIMYATLKSKVFSVNRMIPSLPEQILMANEYLAVYLALGIIESYKRDELKKDDWLIKIPEAYHGGEDAYIKLLCKALYCIPSINHFDIFAYSNILFLLEKYTDDCGEYN